MCIYQLMHGFHSYSYIYHRVGYVEREADFQQDKCVSRCYAIITKGHHSSMTGIF